MEKYTAYADGACHGNPGRGGWGVVIIAPDGSRRELNGHGGHTTNNQMELTAAIEALRAIPAGAHVALYSDSQYLIHTMTAGWKRNANRELWRALDAETRQRTVDFHWVRGHAGNPLNERADELATMGALGKSVAAEPSEMARAIHRRAARVEDATRICAGCGERFVAASTDDRYCNHLRCRLIAAQD